VIAATLLLALDLAAAYGQFGRLGTGPLGGFELSETVELDLADRTTRTYLDRVQEYLADGQWDEAVRTLRQVMEDAGEKLLPVSPRRFVDVRDYCHLQLVGLPPEALSLYRSRIDPLAAKWYEQGIAARDSALLSNVVQQALASSWADEALNALGEIALESADYAAARAYWEKIIPRPPPDGGPRTWLSVADTDLDLAAIRARLVLTSILEGSRSRARDELAALAELHPGARGILGGREVDLVEALEALLAESVDWPQPPVDDDWPTFAGAPSRHKTVPRAPDVGRVAWRVPLRESLPADRLLSDSEVPAHRVAEDGARPLSYHPVVVGNLVLVNSQVEILAMDVASGRPAWGLGSAEIFRDQFDASVHALYHPSSSLGVPRFTMTVFGDRLYARMGTSVTACPPQPGSTGGAGYLVALDLAAQGRLAWKIAPDGPDWAFEGSPVSDGSNLYVAMRRGDVRPQIHVACFDAETGNRRWRCFVAAADTLARGTFYEITHNLLTLHRDTLYLNTNLGAIAAVSAREGSVKWVALYPRVLKGSLLDRPPHYARDLNPCLYDRGTLLVAPSDSGRIYAVDAACGQILWRTGTEVEDVVHLLGVSGDNLLASGRRLYWIGLSREDAGEVRHIWPEGSDNLGYGRGLLAGDFVYWPTRETIHVFQHATGRHVREISLLARGVTGGNLLVGGGRLLIAGPDELVALDTYGGTTQDAPGSLAGWRPTSLPLEAKTDTNPMRERGAQSTASLAIRVGVTLPKTSKLGRGRYGN
jgi:outer membrane protein assembly factor BamB